MTRTILLLSIVCQLEDINQTNVGNYSLLRGWKHSDTQKLWLTAERGWQKKPMFRRKYSGKAYRHTEHLLESLKGDWAEKEQAEGKKQLMLFMFVSYNWQERSFKKYSWRGLFISDHFIASPCHWCVFWYLFLLLNGSTCSKVSNASVSVFLILIYSVQSLVKSVADI